jgi:uncharacterized protein (DUF983 family)
VSDSRKGFADLLFLCLRSRCPVCERGRLFTPLARCRSARALCLPPVRCEVCGFQFGREPGYYFGVLTPVLPILALGTGVFFAGVAFLLFHCDPADALLWGAAGLLFGLAFFMRAAIGVFVAIDHAIDPPPEKADAQR